MQCVDVVRLLKCSNLGFGASKDPARDLAWKGCLGNPYLAEIYYKVWQTHFDLFRATASQNICQQSIYSWIQKELLAPTSLPLMRKVSVSKCFFPLLFLTRSFMELITSLYRLWESDITSNLLFYWNPWGKLITWKAFYMDNLTFMWSVIMHPRWKSKINYMACSLSGAGIYRSHTTIILKTVSLKLQRCEILLTAWTFRTFWLADIKCRGWD